ncbi:MAG: TonB family protein [Acidobacteria bacterium]|nr:TonB family protein [Acidobacteriota bacterium]
MKAVRKWEYKPFEKDGEPVAVQTIVRVRFGNMPANGHALIGAEPIREYSGSDAPVRISGGVMAGQLIQKVTPLYPANARRAGVTGSVILHAIIGKDGLIRDVQVVSGPEMLQIAAASAVRQWRYRPYLKDGEPVEVDTTITVNFNIGR